MQLPNRLKTPSFLQKLQWIADPVKYIENAVQEYPDIFTGEVIGFGDTLVFVNHPQAIKEILTNDRSTFVASSEVNRILQPIVGDYSLMMLDGESHKQRRQLLMPSFHGERMRAYGHLIINLTENIFSQLPLNKPFSALSTMQEISLQVILQAVFGFYEGERCQQLKHLIPTLVMELFRSPLISSFLFFPFLQRDLGSLTPWGKFLRLREQVDELLDAEIAERRKHLAADRIDILSLLMLARDEAGKQMTDRELHDELINLMISGHETTATVMAWGLYWLLKKPEISEKLLQELHSLGDSPDPMKIFQLPYLTAVCNEAMRIYPVSVMTLPRVVQEPVELLGHQLEPDTIVVGCIYLAHRRTDLYPQPEEFRPERFLERQFSPYEFLPFGGGARGCIGQALATFEMKLVLATILSKYQLGLADQRSERPQRRGVVIRPGNGVKIVITGQRMHQQSPTAMVTTPTL
ncbi:cytochrome P450 [Nostoc sp. 106C]|uniref:cytochrome P450 n=1 Tax=Nostoc sp. 106C TaxID=1932667 RepID=UPI000A3A6810|nr:cytochrome P450 [Nostoc sp. 106C]OUL19607.1 cytochrome P450 [Nostoc sp. RF31YmG]OUL26176.1 cytochrome P450 [Nostoc sp. 106C]